VRPESPQGKFEILYLPVTFLYRLIWGRPRVLQCFTDGEALKHRFGVIMNRTVLRYPRPSLGSPLC